MTEEMLFTPRSSGASHSCDFSGNAEHRSKRAAIGPAFVAQR
jgi:hypothetical protein